MTQNIRPHLKGLFLAAFLLSSAAWQLQAQTSSPTDDALLHQFTQYRQQYPKAELLDLYKWCFLDLYGPSHLITDSARCASYIRTEFPQIADNDANVDYEYCAPEGRHVRVNLRLVRDGVIPMPLMVDALMRSSASVFEEQQKGSILSIEEWHQQWKRYLSIIESASPLPNHFEEQRDAIEKLLEEGRYQSFHSQPFNEAYRFHYRVLRRDIFEQEMLPLIQK